MNDNIDLGISLIESCFPLMIGVAVRDLRVCIIRCNNHATWQQGVLSLEKIIVKMVSPLPVKS